MSATFVTGASGLLGGALVAALLDDDVPVVALVRDRATAAIDPRATALVGDVTDPPSLDAHDIGTVFHLAAQSLTHGATAETYRTNIMGTVAVLEAAGAAGADRVVVASSVAALACTDPYAISKAAAEQIARSYWTTHGLPVATARLTHLYGPGDRNPSRLIPELIAAARDGRPPEIRSDGTPRHDYLHVDDAVTALRALTSTPPGEAYNIASGRSASVRDVVQALERAVGRPLHARYGSETAPSTPSVDIADIVDATGWRPEIDLHEGLARVLAAHARAEAA